MKLAYIAPVVGALTAALALGSATAAAESHDWSGLTVGVDGGYADGTIDWVYPANPLIPRPRDVDNGVFGVSLGYLHMFDSGFVLGADASYLHADMDASTPCPNPAFTCASSVPALWTVGARAGFGFDRFLVYGAGGFATTRIETRSFNTATGVTFDTTRGSTTGWHAGAGAAYALGSGFAVGLEYSYVDVGEKRYRSSVIAAEDRDLGGEMNLVRARLTYHLGTF